MALYTIFDKFLPPDTREILEKHLPGKEHWYEVRHFQKVYSFKVASYYEAVSSAKGLVKMYPSASFFYCWVEGGEIHEENIL